MSMIDTTQSALLAAIRANPADDAPRLIYADWLDENGEGPQAAFIRYQMESPQDDNIACGIDGEFSEVHRDWCCDICDEMEWTQYGLHRKVIFRRGFVAEVRLTLAEFLRHAKAIAAVHPVQTWVLTNREPEQFQAGEWAYYVSVEDYRNPDNITHKSWLVPDFYPLISKENVHRFTHRLTKFRSSKEQAIADLQQFCYRWARGEVTE